MIFKHPEVSYDNYLLLGLKSFLLLNNNGHYHIITQRLSAS